MNEQTVEIAAPIGNPPNVPPSWWDMTYDAETEPEWRFGAPMPRSALPCGCHLRRPDYEAVLCAEHLAELNDSTTVTSPAKTDRGCTTLLPLLGLAFVALGAWGALSHHLQPWQWIGFGVLAAFAFVCVGCCANDGTRERLDSLAPRGGAR